MGVAIWWRLRDCGHGSCRFVLDDGQERETVCLSDPASGLLIGHLIWRELYDFSNDCALLVLVSEYSDSADYIRDYETLLVK